MGKKLLQIDSCLVVGSTGRITESIANLAQSRGWECYIIHGARYVKHPSCMKDIQTVSKLGEYLHYAESLLFDNHGLASRCATKRVVEEIKKIKPDVIQLHCVHGYYLNYKILFEYLNTTNIPVVWTFHDCWAFTGHCAHFVTAGCEKWKTGCFNCPIIYSYPKSLFDNSCRNFSVKKNLFTANKKIHIVAVSKWLANLTSLSFLKEKDIRVINNGVDLNVFKPKSRSSNRSKSFQIIAVATAWNNEKGLLDYIKLSELLKEDEELILIGINELPSNSNPFKIKCVPKTDSVAELVDWYNKADIVLSLSKAETFGLTIVEGMACGTPAIVYNNTAQPELVNDSTGYVVDNGDVSGVYKKVCEIKKKGKLSFSHACRDWVESKYDRNKCFEEYLNLYEELTK